MFFFFTYINKMCLRALCRHNFACVCVYERACARVCVCVCVCACKHNFECVCVRASVELYMEPTCAQCVCGYTFLVIAIFVLNVVCSVCVDFNDVAEILLSKLLVIGENGLSKCKHFL